MQKTREKIKEIKKNEKTKNYVSVIGSIRQSKIRRDNEVSISVESLAKRERIRLGHPEDEEQFVTSSYMKKLEENKKFEDE